MRPGSRLGLACPRRNPPQPGGRLLERVCPVGPFSIVPRRLAGGLVLRLPGGNVTEKRILRDAGAAADEGKLIAWTSCAFCATRGPQTAPFRKASGQATPLRGAVRAFPLTVPAPSPAGLATAARPLSPATSRLTRVPAPWGRALCRMSPETAAARGRRPMGPRSRAQALGQATDRACVQRAKEAPGCQVEGQRALTGIGRRT